MQYVQLRENSPLPDVRDCAPFKAVLAIEDSVDADRQREIARWLIDMGVRYVMICGSDGQGWQRTIRQANLDRVSIDDMRPEEFVMITTHRNEGLRSVFWHARKHARHTHVKLHHLLAIHIGKQNRSVEYLAMYDKA